MRSKMFQFDRKDNLSNLFEICLSNKCLLPKSFYAKFKRLFETILKRFFFCSIPRKEYSKPYISKIFHFDRKSFKSIWNILFKQVSIVKKALHKIWITIFETIFQKAFSQNYIYNPFKSIRNYFSNKFLLAKRLYPKFERLFSKQNSQKAYFSIPRKGLFKNIFFENVSNPFEIYFSNKCLSTKGIFLFNYKKCLL